MIIGGQPSVREVSRLEACLLLLAGIYFEFRFVSLLLEFIFPSVIKFFQGFANLDYVFR